MKRAIQFSIEHFRALKEYFSLEKVRESGAMLLCKVSSNYHIIKFISYTLIIPEDRDYEKRTPAFIAYHPDFMEKVFNQCVEENCHLIAIHNHPFAKAWVTFSSHDDHSDRHVLGPYAATYFNNLLIAPVVFNSSMSSLDARMFSANTLIPMDHITIISRDGMKIIPTTTSIRNNGNPQSQLFHHRTVLALGSEFQRRCSRLTVGIIGLGGNGNPVSDLIAKLGAHGIVLVDDDVVEETNLTRLTGATIEDAQQNKPKEEVMRREILRSNPSIIVQPIQDDFLNPKVQQSCKHCDIIFGCVDNDLARFALNKFCIANGIPYFDLGTGATVKNGVLENAGSQVIKTVPGGHFCLECGNYFSRHNLRLSLMTPEERKASSELGYISGEMADFEKTAQPSVAALNRITAAAAVWWMQRYVSGNAERADGLAFDAMAYTLKPWIHPENANKDCMICGKNGIVGLGDEADPYLTRCTPSSPWTDIHPDKPTAEDIEADKDEEKDIA